MGEKIREESGTLTWEDKMNLGLDTIQYWGDTERDFINTWWTRRPN